MAQVAKETGLTRTRKFKVNSEDGKTSRVFNVQVTFDSLDDAVDHAVKDTVRELGIVIRGAQKVGELGPYPAEALFRVDGKGKRVLSPEEKVADLLSAIGQDPKLLAALKAALGGQVVEAPKAPVVKDEEEDESEEKFLGYDAGDLRKLSTKVLRAMALKHELEGVEELIRDELIDELSAL